MLDAGLLFLLLWLPWTQFTWAANAVAGNQRVVRLLFLAATTASIPMAAGVTTAFDDGGPVFAVSLGSIYLAALATMALGLERGTAERSSTVRYAAPNAVAVAVVVSGSFLAGDGRRLAWLAAIGIVLLATMLAGNGDWIMRSGHFAERHGLIVIVALGEVIVAIGVPVATALEEGQGLSAMTVTALVAAGVFAGIVWWSYFDRPQPALEHHAAQLDERDRPRFSRDAYTYAHAPLVAGVILAAAGLEEITLHPGDPTPWWQSPSSPPSPKGGTGSSC